MDLANNLNWCLCKFGCVDMVDPWGEHTDYLMGQNFVDNTVKIVQAA